MYFDQTPVGKHWLFVNDVFWSDGMNCVVFTVTKSLMWFYRNLCYVLLIWKIERLSIQSGIRNNFIVSIVR